jgi:hypothetical protein
VLHRRRAGILCRGVRQQEHRNRKMFLNSRHSSLTLAGAPLPPEIRRRRRVLLSQQSRCRTFIHHLARSDDTGNS